jgi:NADPH:quinone reductase-like Zn-dependent oxidoreductase
MLDSPTMRALRFHAYGEAADVLRLEDAPVPVPAAGRIRAAVHACGLNPADWALCQGLFPGPLPRGVGLDVAGVVDAIGEGVTGVAIGDRICGTADFAGSSSAGASEFAILDHWAAVPASLDFVHAAALPLSVETAHRHLELLHVAAGQTILIHGGGTTVGFAAVQMALRRGARVITTAGDTYAGRLRAMGAQVTSYGEGMVERIQELAGGPLDLVLDAAPAPSDPQLANQLMQGAVARPQDGAAANSALPDLVRAAGGDAGRVVTMSDFKSAVSLGVRTTFDLFRANRAGPVPSYDTLGEFARLAAEGKFTVPVARTFALEDWRTALGISSSRQARGKLVLLTGRSET